MKKTADVPTGAEPPSRKKTWSSRRPGTLLLGACIAVAVVTACWGWRTGGTPGGGGGPLAMVTGPGSLDLTQVAVVSPSSELNAETTALPADDELPVDTARLAGHWVMNDNIQREIVMHPDGTATMNVKLDFVSSLLFAREMKLSLNWKFADGVMTHTLKSGTPQESVDRLIKMFGDSRTYRVIRVTEKEMVLEELGTPGMLEHWLAAE